MLWIGVVLYLIAAIITIIIVIKVGAPSTADINFALGLMCLLAWWSIIAGVVLVALIRIGSRLFKRVIGEAKD